MGEKLIQEFLQKPNFEIVSEIATEQMKFITKAPVKRTLLTSSLFNEIDFLGTHHNLLLLKTKEIEFCSKIEESNSPDSTLDLISPIGDPSNLGALLRSAEAFGVNQVYLTQEAANPFHPKSIKASAGSALRVPFRRLSKDFTTELPMIGLDMHGENITHFEWPKHSLLAIGEEGPGLSIPTSLNLKIPMQTVESLNVSVASSIAMFTWQSRNTN